LLENAGGIAISIYVPTLDTWELIFLALLIVVMAEKVGHTLHSLLMTVSDPCLCTLFFLYFFKIIHNI